MLGKFTYLLFFNTKTQIKENKIYFILNTSRNIVNFSGIFFLKTPSPKCNKQGNNYGHLNRFYVLILFFYMILCMNILLQISDTLKTLFDDIQISLYLCSIRKLIKNITFVPPHKVRSSTPSQTSQDQAMLLSVEERNHELPVSFLSG